jgi:hypothetical protein
MDDFEDRGARMRCAPIEFKRSMILQQHTKGSAIGVQLLIS